mmetsp:Transcript_31069/g.67233  ORF Transcript_31069/g.67233 Transcript_31069/m.67233 type:complete len:800 (-) Transcript_31069:1546-3945(-)
MTRTATLVALLVIPVTSLGLGVILWGLREVSHSLHVHVSMHADIFSHADFPGARALALDLTIDTTQEKERCRRYGWAFDPNRKSRRRLFYGAVMTDDEEVPWWSIRAVAAEGYGIYHAVAYIEANTTYDGHPRTPRFFHGSDELRRLQGGMFGPNTLVTVDPVHVPLNSGDLSRNARLHVHREAIVEKWKQNGMEPHDVGIVANADETFTRDFLRAAQICEVPQFEPNQDCVKPKLLPFAMVFEGSADCIAQHKTWWHPDMALGECMEYIGDPAVHKPVERTALGGIHGPFHVESLEIRRRDDTEKSFPLWNGGDLRTLDGGTRISLEGDIDWSEVSRSNGQPEGVTAFHFHNFFETLSGIRQKYKSSKEPLGAINELRMMAACASNRVDDNSAAMQYRYVPGGMESIKGPVPILFANSGLRKKRNEELYGIIQSDAHTLTDTQSGQALRVSGGSTPGGTSTASTTTNIALTDLAVDEDVVSVQSTTDPAAPLSPIGPDVEFFSGRSGCTLYQPMFLDCGYGGQVFTATMYCKGQNRGMMAFKLPTKVVKGGNRADGPFHYVSTPVDQIRALYQRMLVNSTEDVVLRYFALTFGTVSISRPMLDSLFVMGNTHCWRARLVKFVNSTEEGPVVADVFTPLGRSMDEVFVRQEVSLSTLRHIVRDLVHIYTHLNERNLLLCDVHLRHFVLSEGNQTALIDIESALMIDRRGEAERIRLQQSQLWQVLSIISVMCTRNRRPRDVYKGGKCYVDKHEVAPNVTQLMHSFEECNFDRPMTWRRDTLNNTRQTLNDLAYWSGIHP